MNALTFAIFFVLTCSLLAEETPQPVPTPIEQEAVTARSRALDLAGAFTNDGFRTRDGFWSDTLEANKPLFLEVNLFADNEYWFSAAALPPARKLTLGIYDEKGRPLDGSLYQDGPRAAIGITAPTSGRFFVRVEMTEGEKADFCLIYSYK